MLILEFQIQQEADQCLAAINGLAAQWWMGQGYTVEDGALIGKNAKTHQDQPDKAKTTTWDTVKESPDGTFYFSSLSNDKRFLNWKEALAEIGFVAIGVEREFPEQWKQELEL